GWVRLSWGVSGAAPLALGRGLGPDVAAVAISATMGIVAVGISLPNSPGLVGQFHWLTVLGLSLYLPGDVAQTSGLAFAILLHGISTIWYLAVGGLAMFTSHVSFHEVIAPEPALEETA